MSIDTTGRLNSRIRHLHEEIERCQLTPFGGHTIKLDRLTLFYSGRSTVVIQRWSFDTGGHLTLAVSF